MLLKRKSKKKNEYFKDSQMRKIKHWKCSYFNENNFIGIELLLPQIVQENYIQLMAMEVTANANRPKNNT